MTAPPKATPDSFVGVAPVSWGLDNADLLTQTHAGHWLEEAVYTVEPVESQAGISARGSVVFEDGVEATLLVEEPLEELHTLAGTSKEPYTPTEVVMLKEHTATWRFVLDGGTDRGVEAARYFSRVASTLVEAGAGGIFMPGLVTLHSPRFIKLVTMDPKKPQNITNLCVHAWHADDWMMTRGLTAFGLPELETPIDEGMNAAYFRLLDVAAGMLAQQRPFPEGSNLDVGPKSYRITTGRNGPADEQVPFCGSFGVHTIAPA
jgi:hypothetical protein